MRKTTPVIPAHYLAVTLLCEYQKYTNVCVKDFGEGQSLVADMWNALHVCTSKKNAALFLQTERNWAMPNHLLLAFVSSIWMYQPSVKHHEIHAMSMDAAAWANA
jgi:hypothetical protein